MPQGKELADQIGILLVALCIMLLMIEIMFTDFDDEDDDFY